MQLSSGGLPSTREAVGGGSLGLQELRKEQGKERLLGGRRAGRRPDGIRSSGPDFMLPAKNSQTVVCTLKASRPLVSVDEHTF